MPSWLLFSGFDWKKVGYALMALVFGWAIFRAAHEVSNFFTDVRETKESLKIKDDEINNLKSDNNNLRKENDSKEAVNSALTSSLGVLNGSIELILKNKQSEIENEKKRTEDLQVQLAEIKQGYVGDVCATNPIPDSVVRLHIKQWEASNARNKVHR